MKYSILFLMLIVVSSFSLVQAETFGYGRTESTPINYSTIPTGDNSSWNESYADTLYMDINEATGNSSFNQSLTDDLYANYQFEDNNFNGSGNFTGDYLFGNLSWNYLYDYPIACPAGSSITQLGDSVVCSSFAQENTNVTFQNITANTLTVDTDALVVNAVGYEGRVGIGTTVPTAKLDVNGGFQVLDTISSLNFVLGEIPGKNRMRIYSSEPTIRFINSGNAYANLGIGRLSVGTYGATSAPSGGAIISGNVGIGTTTPSEKLEVNGNILQLDNDKHLFGTTNTDLQISSDGTNPVYNSTGVHTFYNSTGLGTIRYGSALTSTAINKDGNALELFNLGSDLYNQDGSINHIAFGNSYRQVNDTDFSRPEIEYYEVETCETLRENITIEEEVCDYELQGGYYQKICNNVTLTTERNKQTCSEEITNYEEVYDNQDNLIGYDAIYGEVCIDINTTCSNQTMNRTIYPHTKLTDTSDLVIEQANQRQALALINQNVNLYDNITDFETGIMAENIYTQSKVINLLENYALKFLNITLLNNKLTHKNKETLILPDREENVLNVEDRIVDLEGAFSDHMFCMYAHKNYKDYRDCMLNVNPKNISSSH